MTFSELPYRRIDIQEYRGRFAKALDTFRNAADTQAAKDALKACYDLRNAYFTTESLAYIRYTMDTTDAFYSDEHDYYDANRPQAEEMEHEFGLALLASKHRKGLEDAYGTLLFRNTEIALKGFDKAIMDDMAEENRLTSQYTRLIASAQIEFDGKTLNISQLGYYMDSADREVRKKAYRARSDFFAQHARELDEIFDGLVKNRTQQARKLGYKNFVELGYLRRGRNCYGSAEVKAFRELVKKTLVPINRKLYEKQRERLGLDTLYFYDEETVFPDGNPRPQGTADEIFEKARAMFRELSPETGRFFDFMLEHKLFDVEGRRGKAAGGYCTELPDYKFPFVFINDNGTHEDISTLAHESGHAFQYFQSRDIYPPDYVQPTMETAEIHSISMEFFTWPWMESFFGKDADRYRTMHITKALQFIPYGCAVDEFQHIVYENPELTPAERKQAWQRLEHDYLPQLNYGDDPFFGAGGRWQRQLHIYELPFYYIDYCLAQTCALEFWAMAQKEGSAAFAPYLKLCGLGGTDTFTGLLKQVGLASPFEPQCLELVAREAEKWIAASGI